MVSSSDSETISIKGQEFDVTHLKVRASYDRQHSVSWCASSRVVTEDKLAGKLAGLHGKLRDKERDRDFVYQCYVSSLFLDQHVRPERFAFDINADQESLPLLSAFEPNMREIEEAVIAASANFLEPYLKDVRAAGRERVNKFVDEKAPRYRPILPRIEADRLFVDPDISDQDLEIVLHKELAELETQLLSEGHKVLALGADEHSAEYEARLAEYLAKASDIKKSDLANYVFHRKTILEIFEKAIRRGPDGKYSRENIIHEMIMPMGKTSNEIHGDRFNLWIIDERLAFHNYLSSDKALSSLPITDTTDRTEPDLCSLRVFDQPILVGEGDSGSQAAITIIELKRPMRDDAKDPIAQALGYLQGIRDGKVRTASGRPLQKAAEIPGFVYVISDLTQTIEGFCKLHDLTVTYDGTGYFGYKQSYKAYIEVISYDGLIKGAKERNRAFFDKLGLPAS